MVRNAKIMQLKGRQSVAKQLSSLYQASETKHFTFKKQIKAACIPVHFYNI